MNWTISDEELERSVPEFARGLQVLLVDHDIPSLTSLSLMLQRYTFNVTAVQTTMAAISIVRDWQRDQQDCLKVVMAHLNVVNPEHLSFLRTLVREEVPIILISSDKDVSNAQKLLYEGAAFFYQKPIPLSDLKYVWQFACPKKTNNTGKDDNQPVEVKIKKNSMEVLPSFISNDCNNNTEAVLNGETNQTFQVAEGSCSKYVPQPLVIGDEVRKAEPPSLHSAMKRPLHGGNDRGEASHKKLNSGTVKVDIGKPKVVGRGKQDVGGKGKEKIVKTGERAVIDKGKHKAAETGKHIIVDKGKENIADTGKQKIVINTENPIIVETGKQKVVDAGKQNIIDKGKQTVADTGNAVDAGKQKALEETKAIDNNGRTTSRKRSRNVWTSELHLKFTAALSTLGDHLASPKTVHEMMNVPHLTQRQVASHLQKFKAQVQRIGEAAGEDSSASKKEKESLGRMGTFRTDTFGFDYGASTFSFLALRDPFRVWKYDHFLYEELPRRAALMKAIQRPNPVPVSVSNLGGSNLKIGGTRDKQRVPEAEGTKGKGPELNLLKTSLPLGAGAGDMDYFSDLAPIFSSDQLPTEFNIDLGPKFGLTGTRTLSAVNQTQGMGGDLPKLASAMNPLQEALLKNGLSGEASEGYLLRRDGSIISNDFLMAFKDDVPMENVLKEFEGEPKGFADSEDKMNLKDDNKYSQWLEEYLQAPSEA